MNKDLIKTIAISAAFMAMLSLVKCSNTKTQSGLVIEPTDTVPEMVFAARMPAPKVVSGIYKKIMWRKVEPIEYFADPNITGVTILAYWGDLNPAPGVYDWVRLDTLCSRALTCNKKIALNIAFGGVSPNWVKDRAGVITFTEFNHVAQQLKPIPKTFTQPIVYNQSYISDASMFINNLGSHMRGETYWKNVVMVSASGVGKTTEEVRLPNQVNVRIGNYVSTDAVKLWAGAGYAPEKVIDTYTQLAGVWIKAFPKRVISYAYINGDDFVPGEPDVFTSCSMVLTNLCRASENNQCLFKITTLSDRSTEDTKRAVYIKTLNTLVGGQLKEELYSVLPLSDSLKLVRALDNAILFNYSFVEADGATIERFPGIIGRYNNLIK